MAKNRLLYCKLATQIKLSHSFEKAARILIMLSLAGAFAISPSQSSSAAAMATLPVREVLGIDRVAHPVTMGVPFPKGELANENNVRLRDPQGQEVPLQTQVLATWDRDGSSIKWLLLDFQASVKAHQTANYTLEYGSGIIRKAPNTQLTVSETADTVTVNTGPLQFSIRKDRFTFIEEASLNAQKIINPGGELSLIDQNGTIYRSSNPGGEYQVIIEDRGPMRTEIKCEGWYVSDTGDKRFKYVVRFQAYAGKPILRVYHTFIFSEDMFAFRLKNIAIKTPLELGNALDFAIGGDSIIAGKLNGNIHLLQDDFNHYLIENASRQILGQGEKSKGWLDLSDGSRGVTLFIRDLWQNYPLEIEANGKDLIAHLWPLHGDYTAQVQAKKQQALKGEISHFWPFHEGSELNLTAVSPHSHQYDGVNPETFFDVQTTNNAAGIAKTHELVYYFHAGDHQTADVANIAKAYGLELLAINPDWIAQTEALGKIHPYDPIHFPRAEEVLDKSFNAVLKAQEAHQDYGMVNYGDTHYSYGASGSGGRYWMHYRVNWQMAPWVQFVRTADAKYVDFAIAMNRHIMDVDTSQLNFDFTDIHGNQVSKDRGGPVKTHEIGSSHWHSETTRDINMDANPEAFLTYYYLTGYKRAREIAELRGEETLRYGDVFQRWYSARGAAGALGVPIQLYLQTWDQKYLDFANRAFDAIINDKHGRLLRPDGYWTTDSNNWHVMLTTWPLEALEEFCRVTGRADAKAEFIRLAKAEGGMGLTDNTSGFRTHGYPLRLYSYAYELTRDPQFLSYGKHYYDIYMANAEREFSLNSINPDMHSIARILLRLPYFLETLAKFPGTIDKPHYPPAFIRIPQNDKVSFAVNEDIDQAFEIAFTFRNGSDFFGAWEASGNFQVQIYDPNNHLIHQEAFAVPHLFDEVFVNGIDHRIRTYAIPADGKIGDYRIEVSVDKAGHVFSLASNTLDKTAIYVPPEGVMLDRGRYYFFVPADSTQFSLRSANWASFILFDPDGKVYGKATDRYTINPNADQKGKLWSIALSGEWGGSSTIFLESGLTPYLSLSPQSHPEMSSILGDVNQDGRVDARDVRLAVDVMLGFEIRPDVIKRADLDGDGRVNALDIQHITNLMLHE